MQSAAYLGVPDSLLVKNATVINGAQILGIPLHKYSAGFDFSNRHGFEFRIDNYFVGENNSYFRNPFFYSNANISQDLSKHATLNVGFQNLFNNASSIVQATGLAPSVATNQFNPYDVDRQEIF